MDQPETEAADLLAKVEGTDSAADYYARIFTLDRELPFAGHPTLGSCHAWLELGGIARDPERIIQQCGAGLIPLRRSSALLSFSAPPLLRSGPVDESDLAGVAEFLKIDRTAILEAQWIDNGPGWLGVMLASAVSTYLHRYGVRCGQRCSTPGARSRNACRRR